LTLNVYTANTESSRGRIWRNWRYALKKATLTYHFTMCTSSKGNLLQRSGTNHFHHTVNLRVLIGSDNTVRLFHWTLTYLSL